MAVATQPMPLRPAYVPPPVYHPQAGQWVGGGYPQQPVAYGQYPPQLQQQPQYYPQPVYRPVQQPQVYAPQPVMYAPRPPGVPYYPQQQVVPQTPGAHQFTPSPPLVNPMQMQPVAGVVSPPPAAVTSTHMPASAAPHPPSVTSPQAPAAHPHPTPLAPTPSRKDPSCTATKPDSLKIPQTQGDFQALDKWCDRYVDLLTLEELPLDADRSPSIIQSAPPGFWMNRQSMNGCDFVAKCTCPSTTLTRQIQIIGGVEMDMLVGPHVVPHQYRFNAETDKLMYTNPETQPVYDTISHVWGQNLTTMTLAEKSIPCSSRGKLLALERITKHNDAQIWLDVIAIDQTNTKTKCAQVEVMDQVYLNARNCYVLVDADDAEVLRKCAHAVEKFMILLMSGKKDSKDVEKLLGMVPALLEAREAIVKSAGWFGRIWTLQEGVLSPHLVFLEYDLEGCLKQVDTYWLNRDAGAALEMGCFALTSFSHDLRDVPATQAYMVEEGCRIVDGIVGLMANKLFTTTILKVGNKMHLVRSVTALNDRKSSVPADQFYGMAGGGGGLGTLRVDYDAGFEYAQREFAKWVEPMGVLPPFWDTTKNTITDAGNSTPNDWYTAFPSAISLAQSINLVKTKPVLTHPSPSKPTFRLQGSFTFPFEVHPEGHCCCLGCEGGTDKHPSLHGLSPKDPNTMANLLKTLESTCQWGTHSVGSVYTDEECVKTDRGMTHCVRYMDLCELSFDFLEQGKHTILSFCVGQKYLYWPLLMEEEVFNRLQKLWKKKVPFQVCAMIHDAVMFKPLQYTACTVICESDLGNFVVGRAWTASRVWATKTVDVSGVELG
ncbi:WD repeat-containing protein jip5 [Rhizophlyctis rosea]|nr:WD repeat-containing protein jip5 [Rhizophlyctis rosea]